MLQPGEQWVPALRAREENLALSIVLMPPQTVITDMLPYSQHPSCLLCNLLPLQGIEKVSSWVLVPWLVCLSVFWEQMRRVANVWADKFNAAVWTCALNPSEECNFYFSGSKVLHA